MTMTISEATVELAEQLDPDVLLKNIDLPEPSEKATTEFHLSMACLTQVSALKGALLSLAEAGPLRVRYCNGGYIPQGAKVSELSHVDVLEARKALESEGWRFVLAQEKEPNINATTSPEGRDSTSRPEDRTTTHTLSTRGNVLRAVIAKAKEEATDPEDPNSHWSAFVKLAEKEDKPSPLIGFVEGEGVKYQDYSGVKFLSMKNFRRRVSTAKGK